VDEMRWIIKKKSNTAPGLSGLTYQMLSLLPEEASRDMFRLMERMWNAKYVPDFWKLKGLIGLPKVEVVTGVNDLRPIGLIETTRKVWTTMVTRRILGVVRRWLQTNHCGGLANKGTDTALLQLINLLEDLQEVNGAADHVTLDALLDFMSWDTAKAFDLVGNHVQYAAWRRMGVPADIATWLLALNLGGSFVALLPHARKTLDGVRMMGPSDTSHHAKIKALGFVPVRGFTQGDVKSPIAWICFFDILVCALNKCQPDRYPKARTKGSVSHPVRPMVFIDDLTTATCYREHTQEIEDIVAAFNAFFGMVCAVSKFRAVTTQGGDQADLVIRDWNWRPPVVPFQDCHACVRTLGVNVNLAGTWKDQVQEVCHNLTRVGITVRAKKAQPFTKVKAIMMSIQVGVLNKAAGSSWSLEGIKAINLMIAGMIRKALKLAPSYPHRLIHADVGGLGLKSFSQLHREHVKRSLKRVMAGP
jgi:hypothetical protein